jgi:hypothetical protein
MQRLLQLQLNQRTALVTVDTARAVLGVDAETIAARIDEGQIRWVFDIALPGAERRELRLWASSLVAPEIVHRDSARVIAAIIGHQRATLRGGEVEQLLLCSAQHIQRLHEARLLAGQIIGHTRHLTAASLTAFLQARCIA